MLPDSRCLIWGDESEVTVRIEPVSEVRILDCFRDNVVRARIFRRRYNVHFVSISRDDIEFVTKVIDQVIAMFVNWWDAVIVQIL